METGRLRQQLIPALLVNDMGETLAFYRKLGFAVVGENPSEDQPAWAEVVRDGVTLRFHTDPPKGTPTTPTLSGTLYFFPESVATLAAELGDKVEFAWGPEPMPYGMTEFGIRDPNGYYLAFAEPA